MATVKYRTAGRRASVILKILLVSGCFATTALAKQTQVQRGEYLARAGDCISCHSAKGGAPYAGGLRMDTPFGYLLSPNITPDPETGIGKWSADDFYRALHDGLNKHGQDMYPVMPYDFYTKVTRADSDAIYAYLRTREACTQRGGRQSPALSVRSALVDDRVARTVFHRGHVQAGSGANAGMESRRVPD